MTDAELAKEKWLCQSQGDQRRRIRDGKRSATAEFQRALLRVKEYEIEVKAATFEAEKLETDSDGGDSVVFDGLRTVCQVNFTACTLL